MSSVVLTGDTSGTGTITVPAVAGTFTATIGSATGTHYPFTAGTAVASTSGTSIDFTTIPSWVKRITVMFVGVSTSGTSAVITQVGSGSVTSSGYASTALRLSTGGGIAGTNSTAGFLINPNPAAADIVSGHLVLTLSGSNVWVASTVSKCSTSVSAYGGGDVTLAGALDRVRITTAGGTDTFDAGSINIFYE